MTSSAEQMRAWRGTAILTYGFRPFFFAAGVWAALEIVRWAPKFSGDLTRPTALDPMSWNPHKFPFGELSAVIAGFLLTAVPNWTGRLPNFGWPLSGLFALWLIGRLIVAVSGHPPPLAGALADLTMPLVLVAAIRRGIVAARTGAALSALRCWVY